MANATDKLTDRFIAHDVDLQRLQAAQRRKILKDLRALESNIVAKLQRLGGDAPFTKARQQALLRQVRQTIATGYKDLYSTHKAELQEMAAFEAVHLVELVNTSLGTTTLAVGVPESVVKSMLKDDTVLGTPLKSVWEQEAGTLNQAFIAQMRQGILAGETTDQLIQRVRGTKALNYKDGIMEIRRRGAELRVRTSAQSVLNDARFETYKTNDDVIAGVQVLAVLDDRTSEICMARSGMAWDMEGNPLTDETTEDFPGPPPWHPNCRSTLVPIVKTVGEIVGDSAIDKAIRKEVKKLPEKTQASMDGQVAAKLTYEDWLKTKSEDFQQEVLGPGKWKLWKAGKIGLKDLIDQRGNPLTLEQLKAKVRR